MTDTSSFADRAPSSASVIARFDWSTTPLGPMEEWPISLRTVVDMMLNSEFPQAIVWGPEYTTIHNDAFLPILGAKPCAIGRSFADIWSEAWERIGPIARAAYEGKPTFIKDYPLVINRNGRSEQAYFTFSYSPLKDDDGRIAGMIDTVIETTQTVLASQAEERLRLANQVTNDAIWDWNFMTGHVSWNEALAVAYGHKIQEVEPTGQWWIDHIHPEDRERIDISIHAVIDGTGTLWADEYRFKRADGSYAYVYDRGNVIRDEAGQPLRMIGAMLDLSGAKAAEVALRESERRLTTERALLRAVVQQAPIGISIAYGDGHEEINDRLEAMLGPRSRTAGALRSLGIFSVGDVADERPLTAVNETSGEKRRFEVTRTPVRGDDGSILATVSIVADVEERLQAEEQRAVLNRELSHRLKNTLAVVQSVATQTLRGATDIKVAQLTLNERIGALASAHEVLLTGHRDAGPVADLVSAAVSVHDMDGRIRVSGETVMIGPKAALSLSLILHELATNASKYGSLSTEAGHVDVTWRIVSADEAGENLFELQWLESGGPAVDAPAKRSFGSRLIEMGLGGGMQSSSTLDYRPEGLHCRIIAPLSDLQSEH